MSNLHAVEANGSGAGHQARPQHQPHGGIMDTIGRDTEWVRITVRDSSNRPMAAADNADLAAREEGFAFYSEQWYAVACSSYHTMTEAGE